MNRLFAELERRKEAGDPILELHSPNFSLPLADFIRETLNQQFVKYTEQPLSPITAEGHFTARLAISEYYALQFGKQVSPEDIFLVASTSEAYLHLFNILGEQNASFLSGLPNYPLLNDLATAAKVSLRPFPLLSTIHAPDKEFDQEIFTESREGLLLVSPHNPLGLVLGQDFFSRLSGYCIQHDVPLIFDEVFSEFIWSSNQAGSLFPRPSPEEFPILLTLNGVSNLLGLPWLKLGWILLEGFDHQQKVNLREKLLTRLDALLSVNGYAQFSLPELLKQKDRYLEPFKALIQENDKLVRSALKDEHGIEIWPLLAGTQVILEFIDPIFEQDDEALALFLLKDQGLFLFPGYLYDFDAEPELESTPKLLLSLHHETKDLHLGLDKLTQFIQSKYLNKNREASI